MTIHVSAVPYEYVEEIWPTVAGFLSLAARVQGLYKGRDILSMLRSRTVALWVMVDDETMAPVAAATTRVIEYPEMRSLAIDWIGGQRMKEWLPDFAALMDRYALDQQCMQIEGTGRRGWVKALKQFGYEQGLPTYRKILT